jgi:hypothetical protein
MVLIKYMTCEVNANYFHVMNITIFCDVTPCVSMSQVCRRFRETCWVYHLALRYKSDGPGIDSLWCHWILQWHIPSGRTMALGSNQPLVKMSTRNIPGGKGGRCVRLTTSPPSCAERHEIWEPKPPGTLWATPGLSRDSFTFTSFTYHLGC